ncbi:MAG: tetratricopeptide repeat protein [Candidatus Gastranaerophilales bacterium]|nr:tetratricopeptide repeat protein [Candidatus Gastranaerophilales bacterium]
MKNDEAISHNSLSYSLIKLDRLEEAREQIEKTLEINPAFAACYYNLGQIYFRQEKYDEAIDAYKKAMSFDVNLKKAYFNIAGAYHFKGDIENAMKYWEKTIEYDKNNQNAYINLAMTSINKLKDSIKALRYIRSAYEINKFDTEVAFNYGMILLKTGDVYRAEEKFNEVLILNNNMVNAKLGLVECKMKQNKPQEALELLNQMEVDKANEKEYLIMRITVLSVLSRMDNENNQLKDEIIEICDKIRNEYGEIAMVEELRQQK